MDSDDTSCDSSSKSSKDEINTSISVMNPSSNDRLATSSPVPGANGFNSTMDVDSAAESIKLPQTQNGFEGQEINSNHLTVTDESEAEFKPLSYEFDRFSLLTKCSETFKDCDHYLRGCKWSPDGTCLLTNCEDNSLRLFDLPQELYNRTSWTGDTNTLPDMVPSLKVSESGLVYDFDWYPLMTSWNQASSCFVSTSSNCPVHLYDAFTGQIRASYRGYDQYDEVVHAFCVSFGSMGTSLFCGYQNSVKIFDVSRPGRDCISINTKQVGSQKGIISCIEENPDMPKVFAAGTFRKTIGLYTVEGKSLCQLLGQKGGLTQIKFSPSGIRLYSSGRKDSEILCWDLRKPGHVLFSLSRPHSTNQRIYFDLTSNDKYLVSGSTDGKVRVWNVFTILGVESKPDFEFVPHKDCINGVSFHRQMPILATCSGQRHYPDIVSDEEDSQTFTDKNMKNAIENSVKLWWIGSVN